MALEALKVVGAYAVPQLVRHSSEIYGTMGVVFALLAWLLVFGRLVVYTAIVEARQWEGGHADHAEEVSVPTLPAR